MNRLRSLSLGTKLNLSLLAFLLLLAAATSAIILYGFNRTRDNADARTNEALEQGGSLALRAVAGGAAEQGGLLFEAVAEIGRRASIYADARASEVSSPLPAVEFARSDAGHLYDANPDRVSDLVLVNGASPDDALVQRDIAFSAPLDTIFPVLLQGFEGEVGGRNLDPTAIVFISINGVGRSYPPIGSHDQLPANIDYAERTREMGPEQNPERRTIWTAPYEDRAGQGLIATARTPVYVGDEFRGVMEVDVSMANVIAQVNMIRPTEGGFAFYMDSEGNLMESVASARIADESVTNPEIAALLESMRTDPLDDPRSRSAKVKLGDEDFNIAYARVPGLGGTLAAAAPVSDITAAAAPIASGIDDEGARTLQFMLVAMAVLFMLGLLGAAILNRNAVIKPVNSLVSAARAVGSGDLEARVRVAAAGDELTELGLTFNSMVEQLRESERALEQRVQQRTRELNALLSADAELHRSLDLDTVLDALIDAMVDSLNVEKCVVSLRVPGTNKVVIRAARNLGQESIASINEIYRTRQARGEPILVAETTVTNDNSEAPADVRGVFEAEGIRATLNAPIITPAGVVGRFGTAYTAPHTFTDDELRLAQAIAERAGIAIHNAQLADDAQQRARETEALLRADAELFQTLSLDVVLQALVDVAVDVLGADKSIVLLHEGDIDQIRAWRNFAPANIVRFNHTLMGMPHDEPPPKGQVPQVYARLSDAPEFVRTGLSQEGVASHVAVPVRDRERMLGTFGVSFVTEHPFNDNEVRLYQALADRAALAIQNAELYERAQRAGSLEERQRLARELHDSVSQALYGIALGTRTARLRLGDDPHNAAEPIDYVASLAQAGLAEMRALIFELRPESLEQEGLVGALEKYAASIRARYGLDVRLDLMDEPDCGIDVKEAVYRIAQEAIHNVVKHADAQQIDVTFRQRDRELVLEVRDDGRGFDTSASFPGHVGLQSMSERAARLGGTVKVDSGPGQGSLVTASFPC